MKKSILLTCALLISNSAFASEHVHWGYAGEQGPNNWASLSGDNFSCTGKNQSPINLTGFIESELKQPLIHTSSVNSQNINRK